MTIFRPADYHEWREGVPPNELRVISYKLGDAYHCTVDSGRPGTVLSRAEATNRLDAEKAAMALAKEKMSRNGFHDYAPVPPPVFRSPLGRVRVVTASKKKAVPKKKKKKKKKTTIKKKPASGKKSAPKKKK